jgi:hypothetical protein
MLYVHLDQLPPILFEDCDRAQRGSFSVAWLGHHVFPGNGGAYLYALNDDISLMCLACLGSAAGYPPLLGGPRS